jgi:hypothetical protein
MILKQIAGLILMLASGGLFRFALWTQTREKGKKEERRKSSRYQAADALL